jgi:hypothetical protein
MSKTSKARRDAKKKKRPALRGSRGAMPSQPISPAAALVLDGALFATMGGNGSEWVLAIGNDVAAGASEAATIWGVLQAIATKAEANGNLVSVQSATSFREMLDAEPPESELDDFEDLATKVLSIFPLPPGRAALP